MAFLRRLVHSCDLYRPTVAKTASGQTAATVPGTATTAAIPCCLQPGMSARVKRIFGADVQCDGVVYFADGVDVRPNQASTDGKNDRLKITDDRGAVTWWSVVASRDVAGAHRLGAAAVKRSTT